MSIPPSASAQGRRKNRRGETTRTRVLDAALAALASGRPEAVSVNFVAKEVGVTWGTVQYQFGDADGLWAATIDHIMDTAGPVVWGKPSAPSIAERVAEIIDLEWTALGTSYYTARTTLQSNLARTRAELERAYPKTAKALDVVDKIEAAQFASFLEDLPVEKTKVRQVRAFVPTALRALRSAVVFDPRLDVDAALTGLRESVTAYLTTADRSKRNRP